MTKKISFFLFAFLSILIGLYPMIYLFIDRKFGLLKGKSDLILNDIFWNIGFYTHIFLGGLALLVGWIQFVPKWRNSYPKTHRTIGKVYVISAISSSIAGFFIGFSATGGWVTSLGFITLAIIWFSTTLSAFLAIKKGDIQLHQKMMIYSYAACFSAVTLRIHLPILNMITHDFIKAYTIVAWLCWIPNIIVAYFLTRKITKQIN